MKGNCKGGTIKGHVCKYTSPPPVKAGLLNTKICKRLVAGVWLSFVCYDVTYHFPGNGNSLSILASWTEEPGRLQFTGSQRLSDWAQVHQIVKLCVCVCVCVQCIVTQATLKTCHSGWWPLTLHTLLGGRCPPWMTQLPLVVWWLLNSSCSCLSPEFKFI